MDSIFTTYDEKVKALWKSGLSKTLAIELSSTPRPGVISAKTIASLFRTLNCSGWATQVGSNWVWREATPDHVTKSKEVALEREITKHDAETWTCQMSTSSGVQPGSLNRRRAIDLVRFNGNDQYAFVELKVGSDNPLHAAFEILGYALAYLQARNKKWKGEGSHNVFTAKQIELTVLGPEDWYKYKTRKGEECSFDFDWLAFDIENALNSLSEGTPKFSVAFRNYGNVSLERAPSAIRALAKKWW
jgi:hypothetical protein